MDAKKKNHISKKIVEHEMAIQEGKNVQFHQQKIEEIIDTLSMEELLEIDDYIQSNCLTNR